MELYERYEHSAADVIRELGYPGKGALLMWYREWLEERRTGVPSRRGERYARYTSHEVLAAWTGRAGARGARDQARGTV